MARIAEPRDYWIAPEAIFITRNALGDPDRIQGNVAAGAAILCYIKGVQGLEYDNGHNYKSWPLSLSPTYFNTTTPKYIYAAIPKTTQVGTQAVIVFPSQKLDVYGMTEPTVDPETEEEIPGEQIGSTDYYYIWLQGILSASVDDSGATQEREWLQEIQTGLLSSDEALSTLDTDWYTYSQLTSTVSFLKKITMKAGAWFSNLIIGEGTTSGELKGVATNVNATSIADTSTEHIVTPSFVENFVSKRFLSKVNKDSAAGHITFADGLTSLTNVIAKAFSVSSKWLRDIVRSNDPLSNDGEGADDAVLSERRALQTLLRKDRAETLTYLLTMAGGAKTTSLESLSFETGDEGHGFSIKEIGGHYTLEIDDIIARRRFQVNVLDVKRTMFSQGRQVLTEANGTVDIVVPLDDEGEPLGITILGVSDGGQLITVSVSNSSTDEIDIADVWSYKIYSRAQDDEKTIFDYWRVGDLAMCKELNVKEREDGTSYTDTDSESSTYRMTVANHQWHRLVVDHGTETLADGRKYNYVVVSNAHMGGHPETPVRISIPVLSSQPESASYPKKNGYYAKDGQVLSAWSFDGSLANTVPMVGDDYVQYGSVLDTSRQGVTSLSSDSKGGVLTHIKGIGRDIRNESSTYQFTSSDKTLNLGDKVIMKADEFYMSTQTSASTTTYKAVVPYMGTWISGTSVGYANQEWSFNGSKYVCNVDGTTADPPSENWTLSVSKGDTGAGVPGQDALIVTTDPSTLIIEQGLASGSGGHYQRDDAGVYYILGVTKVAVGQIRMFKGNTEVTNFNVVLDDYQGQQGVHSSSNLVPTLNVKTLSVTLSSPTSDDGTKEGEVYLKVSGGGLSQDVHMTVKVYINRVGTYVSQTVGDTTIDIRNRTATVCDDNGNPIEVVWLSTFERSAQGWDSSITELQDGLAAANSSIQQTADSITANVNSITTGKLYELLYPQTTTTYNYTIVSTKANLSKGMWYTLSANGTCVGGAEIYITLHRNNYDLHAITLSSANPTDSVYFIAKYDGEYTLTAKSAGSTGSGYRATLSILLLEQDASLLSQSYLEMKSDHISLGVEGMSNGNILEETDWRGKEITYASFNDRGTWNSSTTYNFLDKVKYWYDDDRWVLLRAVSVQAGAIDPYHWSGNDNPWVLLSEYDAATKLTKWTLSGCAWMVPMAYQRMTSIHLVKSGSDSTQLLQNIASEKITIGNIYTLSFYYRAADALHLFMQRLMDTSAVITDKNNQTGAALVNGNAVALNATDAATGVTLQGNPILPSSNNWKFISITFMANSITSRQFSVQAARSGTSGDVTMLKLEAGSIATPWTELTKDTLKRSGIDIDAEKIVATTDNFEIQNSSGQKTFGIDAQGNLTATGGAKFAGTIEAKVLYTTWQKLDLSDLGNVNLYDALGSTLPQKITLWLDKNKTSYYSRSSTNSRYINLPDPCDFEGLEVEIFFPGNRAYNTDGTTWFSPELRIRSVGPTLTEGYDQKRLHFNAGDEANGVYEDVAPLPIIETNWNMEVSYVYTSHQHYSEPNVLNQEYTSSKVRLLSVKEVEAGGHYYDNVYYDSIAYWRWVVIDATDCSFSPATSP